MREVSTRRCYWLRAGGCVTWRAELGLSWRLDSRKKHSQRSFFRNGRSFGQYLLANKITLSRHRQRCRRVNAYSTVCPHAASDAFYLHVFTRRFLRVSLELHRVWILLQTRSASRSGGPGGRAAGWGQGVSPLWSRLPFVFCEFAPLLILDGVIKSHSERNIPIVHTVILIIIGIPSPTHSLTLGLNPSFSANPPYPAFPFSPSGFTIWISHTVYCYIWAYPSFYFLVFLFLHIFSCRFRAVD